MHISDSSTTSTRCVYERTVGRVVSHNMYLLVMQICLLMNVRWYIKLCHILICVQNGFK